LAERSIRSTDTAGVAFFSPSGEFMAQSSGYQIRLWDAKTLAPRFDLTNSFDPVTLCFSSDSRVLAASGMPAFDSRGITNRLAFWDSLGLRAHPRQLPMSC
jgi:WD40 repeat protein